MILVIAHNKTEVGGANIVCSFIDYLKKKKRNSGFCCLIFLFIDSSKLVVIN